MSEEPKRNPAADDAAESEFIVDEATDEVLRLRLDQFEGPFEVLLYLIRSQEIDIFDIPIFKITEQYLRFLGMMEEENLDVTGEFLVMAATLIQIKSRLLIPAEQAVEDEEFEDEEDPRLELVEKLIEYRRYRDVAQRLERLEEERANWYNRLAKPKIEPSAEDEEELIEVTLYDLIKVFRGVLRYFSDDLFHQVTPEAISVDDKITYIQDRLAQEGSVSWLDLLRESKSRFELVCCFLAILELCRMGRIQFHQHGAFEDIRLFPKANAEVNATA